MKFVLSLLVAASVFDAAFSFEKLIVDPPLEAEEGAKLHASTPGAADVAPGNADLPEPTDASPGEVTTQFHPKLIHADKALCGCLKRLKAQETKMAQKEQKAKCGCMKRVKEQEKRLEEELKKKEEEKEEEQKLRRNRLLSGQAPKKDCGCQRGGHGNKLLCGNLEAILEAHAKKEQEKKEKEAAEKEKAKKEDQKNE